MTQTTAAVSEVTAVPFHDLSSSTSKLFIDFVENPERLAAYFRGDFRSKDDLIASCDRAAGVARDRDAIANVLKVQNARWGGDQKAAQHIDSLRSSESVAVVTGQQVGLFGGPLYTFYKTLTSIKLARKLRDVTGRPVVPIFWLEGEDHDYTEVGGLRILGRDGPISVTYSPTEFDGRPVSGPVGRIILRDDIETAIADLEEGLGKTEFSDEILGWVRDAYQVGRTMQDAFVFLMRRLFPDDGLVFISADDARVKELCVDLFRRELQFPGESSLIVESAGSKLRASYHQQVQSSPTNLFLLGEGGRYALDYVDGSFNLRGTEQGFSTEQLNGLLEVEPERFSPNVVMRPLVQDTVLPTAAYIAGPGEVAYFAQYAELYDWAGVHMPIVYPRISATIVERSIGRVLQKYNLNVADFQRTVEQVFTDIVGEDLDAKVEKAFADAKASIEESLDGVGKRISGIDATLGKSASSTMQAMQVELDKLHKRTVRAEKRNRDTARGRIEKAAENLFPDGKLQERAFSPLQYLNKYGPELLDAMREVLDRDSSHHHILAL